MLRAAVEQFSDKTEKEIQDVARVTLEGHQRAIMGALTVDEIFKDRKKFAEQVFDCASTDLFNMGIQVLDMFHLYHTDFIVNLLGHFLHFERN